MKATHRYEVLMAGASGGADFYAVFRIDDKGRAGQVSRWLAPAAANKAAKEMAERDGVNWYGR